MPVPSRLPIRVIVPAGMLGGGVSKEQIQAGVDKGAAAIALDAGSTDSGPSCLATGVSKISRDAVKRDLRAIMEVGIPARLPILIGSCGTSGTDMGVDWTYDIVRELAAELGISPKVALLYSEMAIDDVAAALKGGRVLPLEPAIDVTEATLRECAHIVGLMGPEPYMRAVAEGADIVLGGRTTDTAVLAAIPIMRGADVAHSWHAGKVAECGGLCTTNPRGGGVMFTVGADYFEIEPLNSDNSCTPASVSAHMLYENSDPFLLTEPGGQLDVTCSKYEQVAPGTVRVSGSVWHEKPYTMKLEGASCGAFQTLMLIGIEDPSVIANLEVFLERMMSHFRKTVEATFAGLENWDISLRPYGWNAVSGLPVPEGYLPREIGLLMVVTAQTQELATRIAKALNSSFFHFPLRPGIPLPSYGFPFSPAEIERGQVYEFRLNHVLSVDDPLSVVRVEWPIAAQLEGSL